MNQVWVFLNYYPINNKNEGLINQLIQSDLFLNQNRITLICFYHIILQIAPIYSPYVPMRAKGKKETRHGGNAESFVVMTSTKKNIPSAQALKSRSGEHIHFRISNNEVNHVHSIRSFIRTFGFT